jgi:hypothetical protein
VKKVNGRIFRIAIVVIAAAMLTVSVNMAFATTTYYDFMTAGGQCVIDVPGQPPIYFLAWHMTGNYYSGSADRLMVYVGPSFVPVAGWENKPARYAFSISLGMTGFTTYLVKPWEIGSFRIDKTSVTYWTIPLVIPATTSTPAVTIPPGLLVFNGHDGLQYGTLGGSIGTKGWSFSLVNYYYDATVTLFCPGWHFLGTVGAASTWGPYGLGPESFESQTWTWTGP